MLATLGKYGLIRDGGRAEAGFHIWGIHAPLALVSPVFGNFLRGLVQPILIGRQTNYFDRCKPFRRIGGRTGRAPSACPRPSKSECYAPQSRAVSPSPRHLACRNILCRPGCRSIPAAKFRHSAELNGATKTALNSPLNELRTQRRSRRKVVK